MAIGKALGTSVSWAFIVGACVLIGIFLYSGGVDWKNFGPATREKVIIINGGRLVLKRAVTLEEHKASLNGVRDIADNTGMFFEFPQDGYYGISTKDLLFPVDLVWVRADGTVVGIKSNNMPGLRDPVQAPAEARYVMMLKAGIASRYDTQTGMRLSI